MKKKAATGDHEHTFMFDPDVETMPRHRLEDFQLDRLKALLGYVYANVPHYKSGFDAAGVKPRDLTVLADLAKFPFTVKDDLRRNYPFGMFAVPADQVIRLHASSGTTGKPTVVGYTHEDIEMWADLMARSLACAGAQPGLNCSIPLGKSMTTVDPSRKRPISSPFLNSSC